MSEESKITSVVKTKDPRRVKAGKRLGMISKQAKERKAREQSERNEASEAENEWFPPINSIGSPVVGIGFVGLVGLALYFGYVKKYKTVIGSHVKSSASDTKDSPGTQNLNPENKTKPKRVYKELDTLD